MAKLTEEFFERDSRQVASDLVGKLLVKNHNGIQLSGVISQVDAYSLEGAEKGKRNQGAFYAPGRIHMYPSQGKYMLAVATLAENVYNEILIRKVIPYEGLEIMRKLRGNCADSALTDGPGKVVQALGIDSSFDEKSLANDATNVWIAEHLIGVKVLKTSAPGQSRDFVGRFELA